ncbi:hypothetical protein UFOVP657_7 [uncultured Caudovirales phage]|uniref:Uncharacterized protein n=1 Tax=uncultured Caudovirales phage TaxID=2100421 RepID=A0A6J5MGJ4_9CAUD|nr:hypothetical protein UFOVP467_27 [uncultured Caudovirales phage]CAB4155543.1 hypothetical protein UFOVP657_7 [uncultured Caudovirales phage]
MKKEETRIIVGFWAVLITLALWHGLFPGRKPVNNKGGNGAHIVARGGHR